MTDTQNDLSIRVAELETALREIVIDEYGYLAGDPSRWPCYRAAQALVGKPLSRTEFLEFTKSLRTPDDDA